jgi:hypothetical protein
MFLTTKIISVVLLKLMFYIYRLNQKVIQEVIFDRIPKMMIEHRTKTNLKIEALI